MLIKGVEFEERKVGRGQGQRGEGKGGEETIR